MVAASKSPIQLVVLELLKQQVVVPPVSMTPAGGNRVTITNHLEKPVTVTHNGHLVAPSDPFTLPARGAGAPPSVTYDVNRASDTPGSVFQLHFEASVVRALGLAGDPTIIIL